MRPLYQEIASLIQARINCAKANNGEWLSHHSDTLKMLCKRFLPSGSGIDDGVRLDDTESTPEKLVFYFSYHHMDENGYYGRWSDYVLTVKPSLTESISLRIIGKNHKQIKDLYETFQYALTQQVWQTEDCKWHSQQYEKTSP
jgi:hypothetical protein